ILDFLKSFFDIDLSLSGSMQILRWVFALSFISVFFSLLYKFAPNLNLPMTHVLPGAIKGSVFSLLITFGFYSYISNFGKFSDCYGTVRVFIIVIIWFFLMGIMLMIGAIINVMYHEYKQNEKTQ